MKLKLNISILSVFIFLIACSKTTKPIDPINPGKVIYAEVELCDDEIKFLCDVPKGEFCNEAFTASFSEVKIQKEDKIDVVLPKPDSVCTSKYRFVSSFIMQFDGKAVMQIDAKLESEDKGGDISCQIVKNGKLLDSIPEKDFYSEINTKIEFEENDLFEIFYNVPKIDSIYNYNITSITQKDKPGTIIVVEE